MYDHEERLRRENEQHLTHLREIDSQIKFHQDEIDKLKDVQRRLAAIQKLVYPISPVKKKAKQNGSVAVSETALQEAIVFLRQNYPAEDFYTSLLVANESWEPSDSHTSKILGILHERGDIRLDSRGIGGRKLFRVVD